MLYFQLYVLGIERINFKGYIWPIIKFFNTLIKVRMVFLLLSHSSVTQTEPYWPAKSGFFYIKIKKPCRSFNFGLTQCFNNNSSDSRQTQSWVQCFNTAMKSPEVDNSANINPESPDLQSWVHSWLNFQRTQLSRTPKRKIMFFHQYLLIGLRIWYSTVLPKIFFWQTVLPKIGNMLLSCSNRQNR